MVGGIGGLDVMGNPYGTDLHRWEDRSLHDADHDWHDDHGTCSWDHWSHNSGCGHDPFSSDFAGFATFLDREAARTDRAAPSEGSGTGLSLVVVQRGPHYDPAIDRHDLQLQRQALAVAVEPCGSDLGPVGFLARVGDMPGEEVGCLGVVCGCGSIRGHDEFLSCLVARCTDQQTARQSPPRHVQHG